MRCSACSCAAVQILRPSAHAASAAITAVSSLVDMPFSELALSRPLSSDPKRAVAVLSYGKSELLDIIKATPVFMGVAH